MNRSQVRLDPEQQRKGVDGREDNISGKIKGKDGSVNTYNAIHPPEDQQQIKGSVLGGDNIERETRDRDSDPIPTKMSTNRTPQTITDQEQKPKAGALRQEEDHKRNVGGSSKEQPKGSDHGLKAKPRIENNKLITDQPPKHHEADFSNSEITPRKTIEHPVPKEDLNHSVSKEQPNNINVRRGDSTVEWVGGNNIAPNHLTGGQPEISSVNQKVLSSNGSSGTKAPNQFGDPTSKQKQINNFQLGPENSADHKNDNATSDYSLPSSDTNNIPVGIPTAENEDKGYQRPVHIEVTITVGEKRNGSDVQDKADENPDRRNAASDFKSFVSSQNPSPDQNNNNKINDGRSRNVAPMVLGQKPITKPPKGTDDQPGCFEWCKKIFCCCC